MPVHRFELFAHYFQFWVENDDDDHDAHFGEWTDEALASRLVVAPRAISVGTARYEVVPVEIIIAEAPPRDEVEGWDQVVEASLDVPSGRMVVAECTEYRPNAARIDVRPGTYAVRVYYGGLSTVDEHGMEGQDRYRLVFWPDEPRERRVLKAYPRAAAQASSD